ncbi:MAG: YIP1 family protein [Clostridia bacterium]|nr:YIP1 family protein [Clostridia bacterium]
MKLLTKDKLHYWGHSLLHPFDGFFEIRFRNQGSMLIATLLLVAYAVLRCLSYQYTGFPMNMNNIDEMDALSIFISTISVVVLGAVSNWTITTLFNGKGKLKDIYIVICYSLTVLIIGDAIVTFASNFVTTEEIMILTSLQMLCYAYFVFLLIAGLGTVHEYSFAGNLASMVMTVVAAAVILFIGVLLFTMLERMFSFVTSVAEELMRRLQ